MPIKNGAPVRQIVKAIEGVVIERKFSDSHDEMAYLVASPDDDGDGQPQVRWLLESQIEATGEPHEDFVAIKDPQGDDTALVIDAVARHFSA